MTAKGRVIAIHPDTATRTCSCLDRKSPAKSA